MGQYADVASADQIDLKSSTTPTGQNGSEKNAGDNTDITDRGAQQKLRDLSDDEVLQFPGIKREHWWQLWRPRSCPLPPKASLEDAEVIPLSNASIISKLTFWASRWVTPIMVKGYQRPLQATDLWKLDPSREAHPLSSRFLERLETRQQAAAEWNARLRDMPPKRRQKLIWATKAAIRRSLPPEFASFGNDRTYRERMITLETEWRNRSGHRFGSVTWALNDVLTGFWAGGLFKVSSDMAQLMSPLLVKALINFSKEVYEANQQGTSQPNIGRGIGMAIGLFCLTVMQSVCQHQFFFRSMATGVLARGTLISAIYQRSISLSVEGRAQHPNGRLMTYLSSDISRVDYCAQWFHAVWTAPIQLTVTLILLLVQIGPSALVGFSLFVLLAPLQTWFMKLSFKVRKKSMKWTDSRSRLLRELLSSMEIIKVFTYEIPFLKRLIHYRRKEMIGIRKILIIRAANQALAFSVPTLASVLAFVTYASTHDDLDPALIFTSLAFFNLLRQPLMFLPRALSSLTDAQNAMERLTEVFEAKVTRTTSNVDRSLPVAIRVQDATFSWSSAPDGKVPSADDGKHSSSVSEIFSFPHVNLEIPRGELIAIIGPVGSGKSSLLQGLIGEMSLLSGTVAFGGRLAYCQQNAWIQNATLRDNIMFGQPWDEHRYWKAIKDANLLPDLEIFADGDLTEIGEKGINLSGGQKQRVNIARALYYDADILLFDDPLSAVDAHVGKALFEHAILPLSKTGKTVLLVTHALHHLAKVDRIYALRQGEIVEQGTYEELVRKSGSFSRLMSEYGGSQESAVAESDKSPSDEGESVMRMPTVQVTTRLTEKIMGKAAGTGKLEGRLMVSEVRKTGSVGRKVYAGYLRAGRARCTLPATICFATLMQVSQVLSTVWLTWWQSTKFNEPWNVYQAVYSALGVSQAIFTFAMGATLGIMSNLASQNLHSSALRNVFYSPKSVFDTQPLGRVLGVFGKDVDTIDNQLADSLRMMVITLATMLGSVIIVTIYLHYFLAVIAFVGIGYWYFAMFYRTSSRELKRLDSMLRSLLYAHFSESLSGLATIRAYGETDRFIKDNAYYMDLENRAYLLTATNQRWLSVRLDFLGACLVFAVAIMCAKGGGGLTPSEIALCLTYLTSITQVLGMVTRQSAEVENNMNAVERVLWYSNKETLPQEAPHEVLATLPASSWPEDGAISFENVVMRYRPKLSPVLKGISFNIAPGAKVGIVGRTGAGKSSITVALFRLAELSSGTITIDGKDISTLGLNALRSRMAIIPQDPVLFSGTLRSNLDPFDLHADEKLYDALKRSCVIVDKQTDALNPVPRFNLETVIEEEGLNLSVGERALISLSRALVKDSKIVVLDEATAAVDLETDAKIQRTIHKEFKGKTLLCIAHRLRTIISWDRILVMNAGNVEEFDTPLCLYDAGGMFKTMCDRSSISRDDIVKARRNDME